MHRFYLPPEQCLEPILFLRGREAHHAAHVLRLRRAESVIVLDGVGHELHCRVGAVQSDQVSLERVQEKLVPPPPCLVTLLQAVPRGQLMESIIQKATELGVARIVPLLSERVVTRLGPAEATAKAAKWQLVAVESIKQCGAAWLPRVETPVTPAQFLERHERFELPLIASLQGDRRHPREYFRAFHLQHGRTPVSACAWIGPEGDFTVAEIEAIRSAGALPITLGPLVLRTETAAVYCLSILDYELHAP